MDLFSLNDRVALVTGGNRGLGRAMALGLVDAGATVAITGRDTDQNELVDKELKDAGAAFSLDVRNEAEVQRTVEAVIERFGRLDILINNAGIVRGGLVTEMSQETWEAVLGTNLTGAFLCAKHAARTMIAQGRGGKIINISSIYAIYGPPDIAEYASAKSGLLGLTRALAVELASHNIQVNAILPGYFETDMPAGMPQQLRSDIRRKTPAGRWGRPEDLVGTAVYLASAASDFITGRSITVDGGYAVADRFVAQ
jgi:2-deoxy-D-gluconate 3-dehydrogenase